MKYQRYPAYKDSGVEWIGEIPEHWKLTKLKSVCHFNYGDSLPTEDRLEGEFPVFGSNGIIDYNSLANTGSPTIIIGRKGSYGKLFYSSLSGFAIDTTFFVNEKTSKVNLKWLYYVLGILHLDMYSLDTGVPGLSRENAYEEIIVLPSNEEQFLISNFLDSRTNRIDILISKQHNMIELLKEKRQAIITNAVTKGLDPNVPMKDSGVEWIGEIPEHWEIKPLFSLMRESKTKNTEDENLEVLSLSYGNIIIRDVDNNFGLLPESFATYQVVDKGNIILRLTDLQNDKKSLRVGLVKKRGIITSAYVCLQTSVDLIPEFAYFMLHSYDIRKVFYGFGGGVRQSMTFKDLKHLPLVYPSTDEQIQIIEHIKTEIDKLDILILKQEKVIELLREYRTSLISHAVTGKIDVRSFAVPINLNSTRT